MANLESRIQDEIFLKFGAVPYMRIWRVNVGMGYSYWQVAKLIKAVKAFNMKAAVEIMKQMRPIRYGTPGQADICGILKPSGRMIAIEVKTATGKQSEIQQSWQAMFESMGGIYILARSNEDVENGLKAAGYIE